MGEPESAKDANEADYRHGSEALAQIFRDFLVRQAVDFIFESNRLHMVVGSTRITFITQPEWVPPEMKKAMESSESHMLTRVADVSTGI